MGLPDGYQYWAFISYSHTDEAWARWLHKALEAYHVPKTLVGRKTADGEIPKRILPVFRDRDELPGAADLGSQVRHALQQSRHLIVLCSPNAATSRWVNEETRLFKSFGREDRVLCLIVDGEPHASEKPEMGDLECFPPAARYTVGKDGEITSRQIEPLAADMRKGKDGKTNAKLKLLAGILNVKFDELKQRERQRILWRRVRIASSMPLVLIFLMLGYTVGSDAGLDFPGGEKVRVLLDRHDISLLRHAHSEGEIRNEAASLRQELLAALRTKRQEDGWIVQNPVRKKMAREVWSHSQALTAIFHSPDFDEQQLRIFLDGLEKPFDPGVDIGHFSPVERGGDKYGWYGFHEGQLRAAPSLWIVSAIAAALHKPDLLVGERRQKALARLTYAQETLKLYRPLDDGGWNMYPNQIEPSHHHMYVTTLALLALLETNHAGLGWEGSVEKRDALLKSTAQWLVDQYDAAASPPGWRVIDEDAYEVQDGLTLQIYATLLRTEDEAGFPLPQYIVDQLYAHLIRCADRDLSYAVSGAEFAARFIDHEGREVLGQESLRYLWYPWAIDSAARWLKRAEKHGVLPEKRVRVRRVLSHLVVDFGSKAVKSAGENHTFVPAEVLYGLGAIPPP